MKYDGFFIFLYCVRFWYTVQMKITDVKKLSELCRIDMTDEEAEKLRGDMESILGYVGEIGSVVAETGTPTAPLHRNILREDGEPHESGMHTDVILAGVPDRDGGYVKVKAIL